MKLRYIACCLLFLFPGCRYFRWGKNVFHQSKTQCTYDTLKQNYIRSLRIYDHFTTLALFDVFWLSDEVRTLYSKEYISRYGYTQERYTTFLRRQLAENDHEIAFYILASVPHACDVLLTDEQTPWTIYLNIHNISYEPKSLKVIDLPPVYQVFFGKRYTISKTAYLVTFAAKTIEGKPIITQATNSLSLCFHMVGIKDECVTWKIASPGRVESRCVDNPDVLAYDM